MKTRVLDKDIFPSMANLTVFLEYALVSPYLHKTFDRNIRELFFAKSKIDKQIDKSTIFERFIDACCWSMTVSEEGGGTRTPLPGYRFILMEMMMLKIWQMIPAIGEYKFKTHEFLNNVLYADFGRAVSWMIEFAHEPHGRLDFNEKRRPALF